ncbi:COG1598 Predicted nuclease of the RNAse H fold, HicB family [Burkholderiaceae bacterium]
MLLSAVITEAEEGGFVALNPETGTTTQGETYQEAIQNLKQATSLYLEEFPMKIHSHPLMTTFEVGHQNWISKPQI